MAKDRCPGKMVNTPGKRAARCALCGAKDYEANEGDLCGALVKSERGGTVRSSKEAKLKEAALSEGEWVVYKTTRKDALRWDSKGIMSLDSNTALLIFPKGFEVPEDPNRTLVWQGAAKTSTDGLGIARRYVKEDVSLKEAVATMRSLLDDVEGDIEAARKQLASLAKKYKRLERTDADKPPANGMPWSPRDGRLRVIENQNVQEGGFTRPVRLGVAIGSKFAQEGEWTKDSTQARLQVVGKIKAEAKEILQALVKAHGGFLVDTYGSAYSVLGWVQK